MNRIVKFLIIIPMTFLFACSAKTTEKTALELGNSVISNFSNDIDMSEITGERISSYYQVDLEKLNDSAVFIESSGGFADEVAIFEAKDNTYVDTLKETVNERIEKRKKDFENYNPEELVKIENASVSVIGNHVILLITEDNSQSEKLINDNF